MNKNELFCKTFKTKNTQLYKIYWISSPEYVNKFKSWVPVFITILIIHYLSITQVVFYIRRDDHDEPFVRSSNEKAFKIFQQSIREASTEFGTSVYAVPKYCNKRDYFSYV